MCFGCDEWSWVEVLKKKLRDKRDGQSMGQGVLEGGLGVGNLLGGKVKRGARRKSKIRGGGGLTPQSETGGGKAKRTVGRLVS